MVAKPLATEIAKRRILDFAIGFGGWFAVNALLYGLNRVLSAVFDVSGAVPFFSGLVLVVNVSGLIVLANQRKPTANGAVVALFLVLLIACVLGIVFLVTCFSGPRM